MALLTERSRLRSDALQALGEADGPWVSVYVGLAIGAFCRFR